MIGQIIGINIAFLFIGYLFGSINWAIILSNKNYHEDIREHGSGNAGGTNMTRTYGKKIGAWVMFLDGLKVVLACFLTWAVKFFSKDGSLLHDNLIVQLAGLGAFIGHIFPVFFKFKGGKGVACFVGFTISFNLAFTIIGAILLIGIVKKTKKMSIGSITCPLIITLLSIIFAVHAIENSWFNTPLLNKVLSKPLWWVNTIFFGSMWIGILITHRSNIKRLLNKEELTVTKTTEEQQ